MALYKVTAAYRNGRVDSPLKKVSGLVGNASTTGACQDFVRALKAACGPLKVEVVVADSDPKAFFGVRFLGKFPS